MLLLAGVVVLAYGITSIGGGKKVFSEMKRMLGDKDSHVRIDSGEDENQFDSEKATSEHDAYDEIEEKLGFYPVRLYYLPEGMSFVEASIEEEMQSARLYYEDKKEGKIWYYVSANNRTGSIGVDIEDELLKEYEVKINGTVVKTQEYQIDNTDNRRWLVSFIYGDSQYSVMIMGINDEEVKRIIENLYFS